MDYEKAYKNALERARKLYNEAKTLDYTQDMEDYETIFPELAESEDEKIRKALINLFKVENFNGYVTLNGIDVDDVITWLEKQGEKTQRTPQWMINFLDENRGKFASLMESYDEQREVEGKLLAIIDWLDKQGESITIKKGKNYLCTKTHKYAGVEWIKATKYYASDNYTLVNQECEYYCPEYSKKEHNNFFKEVEYDGCLEKQGELKETPCDKCKKGLPSHSCQDITALGRCYIENINTSNKVDPKFHEGDWVIDKQGIVHQIANVIENVTCHTYGYDIVGGGYFNDNTEGVRLWTIQDAKPGDILISCGLPFIFKEWNNNCVSYGGINLDGNFIESGWCSWCSGIGVTPATKEQRDQLEKAMTDAGYKWDADKKKLKKIEDEEYNGEDYGIDSLYHAQRILEKTLGKVDGYQTDDGILSHKCAITAVKKLYGQKPSWSEEDDYNLQCMIAKVDNDIQNGNVGRNQELIDWLKSIKPRMEEQQ